MPASLSHREILIWILCLAAIAVGAKNFEIGMSIDAPFYSSVSRHMARTGEWIEMSAETPDFVPYAEHPHLGYWTQALFFKAFGATDPIARIPGQIFYVLCLLMLFYGIRHLSSEKTAIWTILLLWSWDRFSNFFSNAYLDPGLLFFSGTSLFLYTTTKNRALQFLAGMLLALGFMQKGMVNLGFGPAFAFVFFRQAKVDFRQSLKTVLIFFLSFFSVLLLYFILIKTSHVPEFFDLYWKSQSKQRFGSRWDWSRLWGTKYWGLLLKDTHYFLPLALLALFRVKNFTVLLPLILLTTFTVLYASANLNGGQYWITILPWLAWLIAENLLARIPVDTKKLIPISRNLAIALLFVVQYIPLRIHGAKPPDEVAVLDTLKKSHQATELIIDNYPYPSNFGDAGVYVWYNDLPAVYPKPEEVSLARTQSLYLLLNPAPERKAALKTQGWCLAQEFQKSSVWEACLPKEKNLSLNSSRLWL